MERKCAEKYNKWHSKFCFKTAISIVLISNQYKVSLLFIDLVVAFVLFLFMPVLLCCLCCYRFSANKDLYNSFRVLFDKIASVNCANCIGILSFPIYDWQLIWPKVCYLLICRYILMPFCTNLISAICLLSIYVTLFSWSIFSHRRLTGIPENFRHDMFLSFDTFPIKWCDHFCISIPSGKRYF